MISTLTTLTTGDAVDTFYSNKVSFLWDVQGLPATNGVISGIVEQRVASNKWAVATLESTPTTGMNIVQNTFGLRENTYHLVTANVQGMQARSRIVSSGAAGWTAIVEPLVHFEK